MGLYVTGTVMKNRIPKQYGLKKGSAAYKLMQKGDYSSHKHSYLADDGTVKECGLVCWKDGDMVYCLTNSVTTATKGKCFRRQQGGRRIECDRPTTIEEYNQYRGGVDLADQRRKHCDSTIMGQHRWWLKLFYYLLDVATANALVLCNEAMQSKMNMKDFKKKLVLYFVGTKLEVVPRPFGHDVHELVARYKCVFCEKSRTSFSCGNVNCRLPLCSARQKRGLVKQDCFSLAHHDESIRFECKKRHGEMIHKTNIKKRVKPIVK
jgi:Transposase IS4